MDLNMIYLRFIVSVSTLLNYCQAYESCGGGYYCNTGYCCRGGVYCCTYNTGTSGGSLWWVSLIVFFLLAICAVVGWWCRRRRNAVPVQVPTTAVFTTSQPYNPAPPYVATQTTTTAQT
ncbi:uncharacterized protein LOC120341011 isoform X1 [Styela clava]|uniref:uncharacterized protein LOC120341011 isoform X1 n=1 Tax=Styela clava TaxID=7725 RepID=UPI00193A52DE|nr:uncharacterized protein LOC120341011 isoform X1 [Styela clava]